MAARREEVRVDHPGEHFPPPRKIPKGDIVSTETVAGDHTVFKVKVKPEEKADEKADEKD